MEGVFNYLSRMSPFKLLGTFNETGSRALDDRASSISFRNEKKRKRGGERSRKERTEVEEKTNHPCRDDSKVGARRAATGLWNETNRRAGREEASHPGEDRLY